ncbi:hypothetical protein LX36DRAFT_712718 [Colletotrichum falcatum]|nr:hypothetical protein LX36DRAFT_712718 [Colletotrichum falcatum]
MVPASILILALIVFTGFVIPGSESLMINEFHNREFTCGAFVSSPGVPGHENTALANRACSAVGAVPGRLTVDSDAYIGSQYRCFSSHKRRNIAILFAFAIGLHMVYLLATEYVSAKKSKGEVLIFRRGVSAPTRSKADPEASRAFPTGESCARPAMFSSRTSGLDSQTSWSILDLLEKLSRAGQPILCTIHQPSAMLFLARGGRTVAPPPGENPAEWMLTAIVAAPGSATEVDWHQAWKSSPEYQAVQDELSRLKTQGQGAANGEKRSDEDAGLSRREFAAPLRDQFLIVTRRVFQQYWRTPSYIYAKLILCCSAALFIGLVFLDAPPQQHPGAAEPDPLVQH